MLKRYELHNHTTQSDARITCEELIDLMVRDRVDVFALTDHNTISGHRIVRERLEALGHPVECVYGMEYTTYYGHILCLNLNQYVPWDSIDRHCPEKLFEACRRAGALTGVAHPFSYGDPFARGCRFEMEIRDFSSVDFIEIFNNAQPLHEVNERGLKWWEQLTLEGKRLAITAGMDLHGDRDLSMCFATYAEGEPGGDPARDLTQAIRSQRTWISRGVLPRWTREDGGCTFVLEDVHKPGYSAQGPYVLTLTSKDGERRYSIGSEPLWLSDEELGPADALIPKLYAGDVRMENLVSVAPVIRR